MRGSCAWCHERAVAVVGLSAIAFAASGCSGDSDAEAESPVATTSGQVETHSTAQSSVDVSKFRAAFKDTYGEQPWYGQITGMKITGTGLAIRTKLPAGSAWDGEGYWDGDAGAICRAAVGVALDLGLMKQGSRMQSAIEGVGMFGSGGVGLGGCA